jgi:hypothetical protein
LRGDTAAWHGERLSLSRDLGNHATLIQWLVVPDASGSSPPFSGRWMFFCVHKTYSFKYLIEKALF